MSFPIILKKKKKKKKQDTKQFQMWHLLTYREAALHTLSINRTKKHKDVWIKPKKSAHLVQNYVTIKENL